MDRDLRNVRDAAGAARSATPVSDPVAVTSGSAACAVPVDAAIGSSHRSLGERYGWLYGSFWLVFLAFPLFYLLAGDDPPVVKVLGVAVLIVFGAVYVVGNRRMYAEGSGAWRQIALLTIITLVAIPIFGAYVLSLAPFICSFAMMALPLRGGLAVAVPWAVVSVVLAMTIDRSLLQFTLIIVGVSIATAAIGAFERSGRQVEELRLRAVLASDQERIARDVHDVLGHSLTAVVVKAELAQRLMGADPEAARREIGDIEALSRRALAEIRATVGGLRATRLTDEVETARYLLASSGIDLDVDRDADDVDPSASVALAWAVREATTNIVRHSGASSASIRWGRNWVEITDNGRGIEAAAQHHGHGTGLSGLRERVLALGGSMIVQNGPEGTGTTVRVDTAGTP